MLDGISVIQFLWQPFNVVYGSSRILNLKEQAPKLIKRALPDAFLEPDIVEDDSILPEEFQLILDSIKVFGHLEKNFLLEICKNIETIKLEPGHFLFKRGDNDDNVFVVKSGKIRVYIEEVNFIGFWICCWVFYDILPWTVWWIDDGKLLNYKYLSYQNRHNSNDHCGMRSTFWVIL